MVLSTKRGGTLPEGAVSVTQEEALEYQRKFIDTWPSETDVFFLKYGSHINSASTAISSCLILKYFEKYFKLNNSPFLVTSYAACSLIPGLFSFITADKFVTSNVLLMKMDCPICDQLKFAVTQLYVSVAYPAIFGYFSLGSRALLENTYNLPNIKTHPREFWKETFRIFKKSAPAFKFITLGQSVWILFLPYIQNKQLFDVMNKARNNSNNEEFDEFVG